MSCTEIKSNSASAEPGKDFPVRDKDLREGTFYDDPRLVGFSQAAISDMLQAMTIRLMGIVYDTERSLIQGMDSGKRSAKEIYNGLLGNMKAYYEPNIGGATLAGEYGSKLKAAHISEHAAIKQEFANTRALWSSVQTHWPAFVERHKEYLKTLNIKFTSDPEGDITLDDISDYVAEDERNPNEYMRDDMKHDSKKSSPAAFRLAMATIPNSQRAPDGSLISKIDNSIAKLPKLANFSSLWNYTLYSAANTNGLFDIYSKLAKIAADPSKLINANLQRALNRLDLSKGFEGKSLDDIRFALQAESVWTVQKPDFYNQYIDQNGHNHNAKTVINNKSQEVKATWLANMKNSGAVKASGNNFVFNKVDPKATLPEFAHSLGINITKKDIDKLPVGPRSEINTELGAIKNMINKMAETGKKVGFLGKESLDFDSRLNTLADLYSTYVTGDDTQSGHLNLDNKNTSNFIRNNALSYILNDANDSKTLAEFTQKQPIFDSNTGDIFRRDSVIINQIMFKGGKFSTPVRLSLVEGVRQIGNSSPSSDLTIHERRLYQFNDNLNGIHYTLVPADGKNEYAIKPGHFISPDTFFNNRGSAIARYYDIMHGYLETEIALAKDYAITPARSNIVNLTKKMGDRVKGNSLRFFNDILPKDIADAIHSEVIDGGEHIKLEDVLPRAEFNTIIGKLAVDKAKASLQTFSDSKIFDYNRENNTFRLNGIDRDFLTEYVDKDKSKTQYSEKQALDLMAFREMNYIIGNIEQHKILFGDPAEFDIKNGKSDELKRTKSFLGGIEPIHVDNETGEKGLNKRLDAILNLAHGKIKLEPKDPGYTQFKNYANTLTLKDVIVKSSSYDDLVKILGEDMAKPYKNINETDAQVIQSPTHYREVMYKSGGQVPAKMEADFQLQFASERQRKSKSDSEPYVYTNPELEKADRELVEAHPFRDSSITYPIQKLKAAGPAYVDGVAVNHIIKAAWAPQFYDWTDDTLNCELYDTMQKEGIDFVMFESAHKVGTSKDSLISLYNENGGVNKEAFTNAIPQQIPHAIMGIQVPQQTKKGGVTEGSQLRSMAPVDLYSNGVPKDYTAQFKGDEVNSKIAWDRLSDTEKDKQSPIHKLIGDYEHALSAMADKRVDNKLKEFGVVDNGNGTYSIPSKGKIAQFLRNEVTRRELPDNVRRGLEIGKDGEFETPLESSVRYNELRSILYSVVNKTIIRAKVNGGQKTTRSVVGFEPEEGRGEPDKDGKFESNVLNFYKQGEDGKTIPAEAFMPYYFGDEVREKYSAIHGLKNDKEFYEHLHKEMMKTKEGRDLLHIIQFHIPLQGTNSVDHTIIKKFLPVQMGDTIVNGSETTAKTSLDFDIDKQNVYTYNYYVDKNTGMPRKIKMRSVNTDSEEELKNYYEESGMLEGRREWEAYQKDPARFAQQALDKGLEDSDTPDYVQSWPEFLESAKGSDPLKLNSIKALENHHLDLLREIMSLPEKYKSLVTPNDASDTKKISAEIVKLLHPEGTESKGVVGSILDSGYMAKKRQAFLDAKGGIGIAAVSNTSHSIAQLAPLIYTGSVEMKLPHNEVEGQLSLSSILAKDGSVISNNISQTIDGFVDVAKDEFLSEMGINYNTAKNWLLNLRVGTGKRSAALFNNQPAILKYLELKEIHDNVSGINKNVKKLSIGNLWKEVAKSFGAIGRKVISEGKGKKFIKPTIFTDAEMKEMMEKYNSGKKLLDSENIRQLQMLDEYLNYDSVAWDLFRRNQGANWATDSGGDPNDIRRKEILYNRTKDLPFTSVDNVFNKTYIGGYKDNILKMNDVLKEVLPIQKGESGKILDDLMRDISVTGYIGSQDFPTKSLKIEKSLLDHIIQTKALYQGVPLNTYVEQAMTGHTSAANWIKAMQNSSSIVLRNNPFLLAVRPNTDKREGEPHSIELMQKDTDAFTSDNLTDGLRNLRDDDSTEVTVNGITRTPSKIYNGLKIAGILQSGVQNTPRSWTHLIPNEDYGPIVKNAVSSIDSGVNNYYDNYNAFRALWNDDKLVPIVPKEYTDDPTDPTRAIEVKPELNGAKFRELLGSPTSVIQLDAWKYKGKPFVKTVDYPKKNDNEVPARVVKLYRKVETPSPILRYEADELSGRPIATKMLVYTEINKWGALNAQEYYEDTVDSVFPSNPVIDELSDYDINNALADSKTPGTEKWDVYNPDEELWTLKDDSDNGSDDVGNEPPPPSGDDVIKNLEDKGAITREDCPPEA